MSPREIKNRFVEMLFKDGIVSGHPYKDPSTYDKDEKELFEKMKLNLLNAVIESYDILCDMTQEELYEDVFLLDEYEVNSVENHPFNRVFYAIWDLSLIME